MLQPEVTRIKTKTKLFPTKNEKENKTNLSLTINGKKDENIKILGQKCQNDFLGQKLPF